MPPAKQTGWGEGNRVFCKKLKEGIGTASSVCKRDVPADVPALERLFNSPGAPNPRAAQPCACASTEDAGGSEVTTRVRSTFR